MVKFRGRTYGLVSHAWKCSSVPVEPCTSDVPAAGYARMKIGPTFGNWP